MSRRVSRRALLRATALAATIGVLQACAPAAQPTPAPAKPAETPKPAAPATPTPAAKPAVQPTPTPAAKPGLTVKPGVEITVATRGGSDGEIMEQSVKKFTEQTGIRAKHVAYGGEPEYWAKVQSLHAIKQVADVIWASTGNFHNFANRGILAELDPLIKADNYDMSDYLPNAIQTLSFKGKLYGLPWGGHPGNAGLLYNVDILTKAGINATEDPESLLDWTYDTLMEAARKVTQDVDKDGRIDIYGYRPGTDYLSLLNVIGAYGGHWLTPDGTQLTIDTPEFLKAMNWVRDCFVTYKVSPAPDPNINTDELFASGKLAMLHTGYWGQFSPGERAIQGRFKWNVTLQPLGPARKRGTQLTINGQTISAISPNKEAAWLFLKWLMEPENHIPIVLSGGSRPALRKSVLEHPRLMKEMKAHKVFAKLIMEAEPWRMPANFRWPEFNETIKQVFAGVWAGKQTVEEALPEAKKKLQAVLDKPPAE